MVANLTDSVTGTEVASRVDEKSKVTCTPTTTGPDGRKFDLRTMNTVAYRAYDREHDRTYKLHVCTPAPSSPCIRRPVRETASMCRTSTTGHHKEDPPLLLSEWVNEETRSEVTFESFRDPSTGQRGLTINTHLVTPVPNSGQHFTRVDIVCAARGALLNASVVASGPDILTKLHYRINHQAGCGTGLDVDE